MIYFIFGAAISIITFASWAYFRGEWKEIHQRIIGAAVVVYGLYLAALTGSYTSLVLPGIGSIALGATSGAAAGFATWVVLGTVGVATGGMGIAVGALAMTTIGATFGTVGGAASGFGLQRISYPLVSPFFWVPLVILGCYFLWGKKKRKMPELSKPQE